METNLSAVQKELERANKRIQDLRGALQEFSDQSDLENDDILDDSASSAGEEDGHWAAKDGARTYKRHHHLHSSDLQEETTAATRRIADVDDFDNITPNTLHKWRAERQNDDSDSFVGGKREDGDEQWYNSTASSTSVAGVRDRGLEDGLDSHLPKISTPERGRRETEKAWFEDSSPPASPKPAFL